MSKSEYVMLAHTFNPDKDRVGGWWLSEKLDGCRAIWDGGISRGLPASEVPYANTVKDKRFVDEPIATGLWSRAGKVIHAPDWWLNELPNVVLDGELWIGNGRFQELRTIVSSNTPGDGWTDVTFQVFDSPTSFFNHRGIKIRNEYSFFVKANAYQWALDRGVRLVSPNWNFELRTIFLKNLKNNVVKPLVQYRLPLTNIGALEEISFHLTQTVKDGGEGVMLRWGSSSWVTERSHCLLKHKPINTMDGTVIGYTAGEEGKTGQLLGKLGALILRLENGKELKLSGLTHLQREIKNDITKAFAETFPGDRLEDYYSHHLFPKGTVVEFKYRELSDDGIPKEARFDRIK